MELNYTANWNNKLNKLKGMHSAIASLCEGKSVAYIDIPLHFNVGDHLIYAGTEAFIKAHKINVIYRAFDHNVRFKAIEDADVILLHGGGNFGDIYPRHQRLRESVIKKFPNKRVIQLPQTIHFSSEQEMLNSSEIFAKHSDIHIYLRDTKSLKIAEKFTKNASLMPDMAHSLHPLIDVSEVESLEITKPKIINLRRIDVEKVSIEVPINKASFDWVNLLAPSDYKNYNHINRFQRFNFLTNRLVNSWKTHSDSLIFRSVNYFSMHNVVYTDRLHGFILSYLLGKNIKLLDNSYGKNSGYFNEWVNDKDLVEIISTHKD